MNDIKTHDVQQDQTKVVAVAHQGLHFRQPQKEETVESDGHKRAANEK